MSGQNPRPSSFGRCRSGPSPRGRATPESWPAGSGIDLRDAKARSNDWRRPGSVGRVFQSTAIKGWRVGSQPPFLFSPRGFGFGCRDCTRRENYDMDYDTVRDEAADGSAAKRRRMEVSTTGAAQR